MRSALVPQPGGGAETTCSPSSCSHTSSEVEPRLGRKRTVDKGPRTIDIDILTFGRFVMDSEGPHRSRIRG